MNKIKKLGVSIFIFLSLVFIFPQKSHAQYVDIVNAVKEYGLDTAVNIVAKQMIQKIVAQTVNWINAGFQGNPGFVSDPGKFFLDIADREASRFLSQQGLANLCSPFNAKVRLALVKSYLDDTDNKVYACTLDKLRNNYDDFVQDFDQGGWDGWFEITQNRQNNPYGAYRDAKDKLSISIGVQDSKYQNQMDWGKGFLSWEVCPEGQDYIDPNTGKKECFGVKETATPGSVIETQLNKVLGGGYEKLVSADEISELIGALLNQLTSKILGGGKGLLGGSSRDSGGRTFTTHLLNELPENIAPVPEPPPIPRCQTDLGYL
ncbi:MAG TPA: hypothetical protein VGC58_01705, partial [Candidatus Paceibacterota bacterium]